jgi:CRP/FNR family transcriptional regulator, anaerobic regulatory protein
MDMSSGMREIFEPELVIQLERQGKKISFHAGDTILSIGQTIRVTPIVMSGSIKVYRADDDGNELLLYYVNPSEGCAMTFTCCMQHQPSEIKAVGEEDGDLIAIPVDVMDTWLSRYPSWKNFVMKSIHNRLNDLLRTIDQIAFQKLDERLIQYLRTEASTRKSSLLNLSHELIANDLATSRVVISRLLKKLENDNKLILYRNQIKLLKEL